MTTDLFEERIALKLADMIGDPRYAGWSMQERKSQAVKRLRQDLENELRLAIHDLEYYGAPNLIKAATKASAYLTLFNSVYR